MNKTQLREWIIRPPLKALNLWSEAAENLLMGTCAQESHLGEYIKQVNGPALGIFQMEPATHDDIWGHLNTDLMRQARQAAGMFHPKAEIMIYNLHYAVIMCRLHYRRVKEPLPDANDIAGLAKYWKKYYNTHLGKGKEQDFITNYKILVGI
jgi:hypothetical protein